MRYSDLYPDMNLEISGEGGALSWRLVSQDHQPTLSLQDLRLRIEGANDVSVEGNFIRVKTAIGDILLPLFEVEGNIPAHQQPILISQAGVFEISSPITTGTAGNMDLLTAGHNTLVFSTYLGGSGGDDTDEEGRSIAVDKKGAVYITGYTQSPDFPVTPGAYDDNNDAWASAFVAKINPQGSRLVYATYLGGNSYSEGNGIVVDQSGAAYITGETDASDFPTTSKAFDRSFNASGFGEAFVVKLDPLGSSLVFSTFLGGEGYEYGASIVLGTNEVIYVAGGTTSPDFPVTSNAFDRNCGTDGTCNADPDPAADVFVAKLNRRGTALIYSTYLGGQSYDGGNGIAMDSSGAAYVTGSTNSPDFPVTASAFDKTCGTDGSCNESVDAFVAKLKPNGNSLGYATFLGGELVDTGVDLAVDSQGRVYVTGFTSSVDFPVTSGGFDQTFGGVTDSFVAKLSIKGSRLIYATYIGGVGLDCPYGAGSCDIAVNGLGEALITGISFSADFPTTIAALDFDCSDGDAYLAKLNASGKKLVYSSCFGGSGIDGGSSIVLDKHGDAYFTGFTNSLDFTTTRKAYDRSFNGEKEDTFVVKISLK